MNRTHALLATVMTVALFPSCDPGPEAELDPLDIDAADEPASPSAPAAELLDDADPRFDQICQSYTFTTQQNESQTIACSLTSPAPDLPDLFPEWYELRMDWLRASATATCMASGARDGAGNYPFGVHASAGDLDRRTVGDVQTSAGGVTPPVCATVCQSHGKQWDMTAAHAGTCAFNAVTNVSPAAHFNEGPACPSPGARRWRTTAGVLFDCGCVCT